MINKKLLSGYLSINSWRIIFFQNFLILLIGIVLPVNFLLMFSAPLISDFIALLLNLLIGFALFFDLVAVAICVFTLFYEKDIQNNRSKAILAGIFGMLWLFITLLWRIIIIINRAYIAHCIISLCS